MNIDIIFDYLTLCSYFKRSKSVWNGALSEQLLLRNTVKKLDSINNDLITQKIQDYESKKFKDKVGELANNVWYFILNRNDVVDTRKFIVAKPELDEFLRMYGHHTRRVTFGAFGRISGDLYTDIIGQ